jgi:hypothetical protein
MGHMNYSDLSKQSLINLLMATVNYKCELEQQNKELIEFVKNVEHYSGPYSGRPNGFETEGLLHARSEELLRKYTERVKE